MCLHDTLNGTLAESWKSGGNIYNPLAILVLLDNFLVLYEAVKLPLSACGFLLEIMTDTQLVHLRRGDTQRVDNGLVCQPIAASSVHRPYRGLHYIIGKRFRKSLVSIVNHHFSRFWVVSALCGAVVHENEILPFFSYVVVPYTQPPFKPVNSVCHNAFCFFA